MNRVSSSVRRQRGGNCRWAATPLSRFLRVTPPPPQLIIGAAVLVVLVVAIALFNHFHLQWVVNYVRQAARVLKPQGRFFGTFLLLNKLSIQSINKRLKPPYQFGWRDTNQWHDFINRPLYNVAHSEIVIRRAFLDNHLMIKEPIRYGNWCESPIALAGPDVLIAKRGYR